MHIHIANVIHLYAVPCYAFLSLIFALIVYVCVHTYVRM